MTRDVPASAPHPVAPVPGPVRIRRAVPEDAAVLLPLIHEAMRLYAEASGIPGSLDSLREGLSDVERHIRDDVVLVAEYVQDGTPSVVGTLRLSPGDDPESSYLSRFAVDPDLQRIGVGGALMHAVDLLASAEGLRRVRLHTALSNLPLIRFYRARGFEPVGSESSRGYPRALLEKTYPQAPGG